MKFDLGGTIDKSYRKTQNFSVSDFIIYQICIEAAIFFKMISTEISIYWPKLMTNKCFYPLCLHLRICTK